MPAKYYLGSRALPEAAGETLEQLAVVSRVKCRKQRAGLA